MRSTALMHFLQRPFHLRRVGGHFETPRYLLKWLFISSLIGLVAGIGAIVFTLAIKLATQFFLGRLVGYLPPDPSGEGTASVMPLWAAARPWLLPVVTMVGGLLSGIIVFSLAPEAEGHGTDAAIAAFHQGKPIRARIPLVKLVASAITIGSGGSAGREGPSAQISAGFGSLLGNLLHLDTQDRRIAIATGIGAGIGAIFRAPLGGAVLAAEILYKHDLEVEALIPALIASIIGYSVFGAYFGWNPIFAGPCQSGLHLTCPAALLHPDRALMWSDRAALRSWLLWYHAQVPPATAAQVAQTGHRGIVRGPDRPGSAGGAGYGLWLGAGEYEPGSPLDPAVGGPAAAVCQDCDHRVLHRFGWLWRHLWTRHGHRGHGRGDRLAAELPCAAGRSRYPGPVRDRRHDGALRGNRARAAGGHAHGGRDDGQPVFTCACYASGGHLRHHGWGEDDLHQPGRHARRLACAPAAILLPAAFDAHGAPGDDATRAEFLAVANRGGGGDVARRTHHQWSARPRRTWQSPGSAHTRRYRAHTGGFARRVPRRGSDESGGAPRAA